MRSTLVCLSLFVVCTYSTRLAAQDVSPEPRQQGLSVPPGEPEARHQHTTSRESLAEHRARVAAKMFKPRAPLRPLPPEPLIQTLAERRPELARRLERLRRESPERFRDLITDALAVRIEDVLRRERQHTAPPTQTPLGFERQPTWRRAIRSEPRLRGVFEAAPEPGPVPTPFGATRSEDLFDVELGLPSSKLAQRHQHLQNQHNQLEQDTQRLVERIRSRSATGEHGAHAELRETLARTVHEHFQVRTELRQAELDRIDAELQRLRETVEVLRRDFERRSRERDAIIEKRIRKLLGEDSGGW
ncbi:MAG: hypothetical protein IH986_02475 [Planctomycetes bacterium]|nr:hypothetical protein [Planctomycetota bacterium]